MANFRFWINVGLSSYSTVLLIFLIISTNRQTVEKTEHPRRQKLFLMFLVLTLFMLTVDTVSRLDGIPGFLAMLCQSSMFLLFFFEPMLVFNWFLYICEQTDVGAQNERTGAIVKLAFFAINAAAVTMTPFTGMIYYFSDDLKYHRGPYFFITSTVMMLMMAHVELLLIRKRNTLERRHFWSFLLFPVIPIIAAAVQIAAYGISMALNGIVFSILLVFFYVQSRNLDVDYLTGLYNRRKLDIVMRQKVAACEPGKSFSAILLDINKFKTINDTLGHNAGDTALADAASILRMCLRAGTFIARYGGDEFCVILDITKQNDLDHVMKRIRQRAEDFNERSGKPYTITFSMGGDIYDTSLSATAEDFQKHIDELMYREKHALGADRQELSAVVSTPKRRLTDR